MSPRQPTARKSTRNYSPAMRQYLAQLTDLAWQAEHLEGEYWQVVTAKGETLAIVNDTVTQANINAQQAAQLMADSPQLLNELVLAHELIRVALSLMNTQMKGQWTDKIALLGLDGEGTTRANQRLALLTKYRHLLGGVK